MRTFSHENWLKPPYNRTAFQHVQTLFPTDRLRRGDSEATRLLAEPRDLGQIRFKGADGEEQSIDQMVERTETDAFVVLHKGKLIEERYANGMQRDSVHLINSISKTFVGMLAGILVEEGALNPDHLLSQYAPQFEGSAFDQTTVRHALDMTGAAKFGEDYPNWDDDFWVETAVLGWRPDLAGQAGTRSLKQFVFTRSDKEQEDGEKWHYRTLMTNALAIALEEATGTPIQALVEQKLWQKLRPEYDSNVVLDETGFAYFGAGMSVSARDLARFGQMLLDDGMVAGKQIVPARWVNATREGSDKLRGFFADTDASVMFPGWHYQNQTWACQSDGVLCCIGIYGQTIYVHQPSQSVIVKLSTHPEALNIGRFADTMLAMGALTRELAK